jgi:predicted RNA polymerase sigma factor
VDARRVTPLDPAAQDLLRTLAPQVLGTLVRRYREFAGCEDAVQEALIAAATQWPARGVPANPKGWLITVATRRLTDQVRADAAGVNERDETLDLYFTCCHPALSPASQVALTLRAVGGLTTAEIARAFLVPEATMAQRLSRAKQTIKAAGGHFPAPSEQERRARLPAVLHVVYLIFSEGYSASSGDRVIRVELSSEAIRVARLLAELVPDDSEVLGLLALMLFTDARRAARTGPNGELVPLDEQDRTIWDRRAIDEGQRVLERALARGTAGPYQIQAAIAALHDAAPGTDATDWPQILALYGLLGRINNSPMVRLSEAIALAMVQGPAAGLAALDAVAADARLADHHRVDAARAHLLERAGDYGAAIACYHRAAARTTSIPERNYLLLHAARLAGAPSIER